MEDNLRELYQEVILDHSKHPRHFGELPTATHNAEGHNPLCGDRVKIHLFVDKDKIADVAFEGKGCAISQASASLMTDLIKGKTLAEAQALIQRFHGMVTSEDEPAQRDTEGLGKTTILAGVREFPACVKCATLAWHTMKSALENGAAVTA